MHKRSRIKIEDLGRFLVYVLGHKPYDFGLVPDSDGFVPLKELLRAIHEEPAWRYVRQGHIDEVFVGKDRPLFQIEERKIRTCDRRWNLDLDRPVSSIPKRIFHGIRRKTHPTALEKGLRAMEGKYHVLSPDRTMAERLGKRRDPRPVILEIAAETAQREGVPFYAFGDLFLSPEIPVKYVAGPPIPKSILKKKEKIPKEKQQPEPGFQAGTFPLKLDGDMGRSRWAKGKKKKGWKEEWRRYRKGK